VPDCFQSLNPSPERADSLCAHPVLYADARPSIRDGDFALYRPGADDLIDQVIASGGSYSHAGMLFWDMMAGRKRLFLAETLQWRGGRTGLFSGQLKGWPGQWDIWRPPQPYNTEAAVDEMLTIEGRNYGWLALARVAVQHTRFLKRWFPPLSDAEVRRRRLPPFCSGAVAEAAGAGGFDPSDKPDSITEPNDLVIKATYICTPTGKTCRIGGSA